MKHWIIFTLLALNVTAFAQSSTSIVGSSTSVTLVQPSGTLRKVEISPIHLGKAWTNARLLNAMSVSDWIPKRVQLAITQREMNQSHVRVVASARYQMLPIFDRDVIVIVGNSGTVDNIHANLPEFDTVHQPTVDPSTVLDVLNNYLLRRFGPANVHTTSAPTDGWMQVGTQLWPVSELEILDPTGFRHFTARVDRVNGRVISLTERTKH